MPNPNEEEIEIWGQMSGGCRAVSAGPALFIADGAPDAMAVTGSPCSIASPDEAAGFYVSMFLMIATGWTTGGAHQRRCSAQWRVETREFRRVSLVPGPARLQRCWQS